MADYFGAKITNLHLWNAQTYDHYPGVNFGVLEHKKANFTTTISVRRISRDLHTRGRTILAPKLPLEVIQGQGEFGKVVYGFLLVPNSNFGRRMRCLRDVCDFSLEPFLGIPCFDP